MVNFRITEGKTYTEEQYEEFKEAYLNDFDHSVKEIRDKLRVNYNTYTRWSQQIREETGLCRCGSMKMLVPYVSRKKDTTRKSTHCYREYNGKYTIRKCINNKVLHFGTFESEEEALAEVERLKANNWVKI